MAYFELDNLQRKFDHAAMAYSVESRMPFMDYRLITYTLALPASQMVSGGFTKVVLRRAMSGTVPEPVLRRRTKLGFPTPPEWFADPVTQAWCREIISEPGFQKSVFFETGPDSQVGLKKSVTSAHGRLATPILYQIS